MTADGKNGDAPADALEAAARLEATMLGLSSDLRFLRIYGRRNRLLIQIVGVVIALMLLMGVSLLHATDRANEAASDAKAASSAATQVRLSQRVTCEAGNETRELSRQLWTYILDATAHGPGVSAEKKRQIADFRAYVNATFAARDCDKVAPPAK